MPIRSRSRSPGSPQYAPEWVKTSKPVHYLRVEEGRFDASGKWIMERNWNGDQVDSSLNLPALRS